MTSRYETAMRQWSGLESSFDGTVPPSRYLPIVMMRKTIEAYDGSLVDVELRLHSDGLFRFEGTRPVWKANRRDMLAFFREGLEKMEAMLANADEGDDDDV